MRSRGPVAVGRTAVLVLPLVLALVATACGSGGGHPGRPVTDARIAARFPVALVATDDGGLLYAERLTGRVRRIDADGRRRTRPVATVTVSRTGQRGLLGLARVGDELYATATRRGGDRRIEVLRLLPTRRLVWRGPPSSRLANGGHLEWDATRHRLVLGVGDLQAHRLVADPEAPNGKLLLIDPAGPPDQTPAVLSGGWNNPFAFTVLADGAVWVADNVPGQQGERLARGDRDGRPTRVRRLPRDTVPAALAAERRTSLLLCSFTSMRIVRYGISGARPRRTGGPSPGPPCATGIAVAGARVWTATPDAVFRVSRTALDARLATRGR